MWLASVTAVCIGLNRKRVYSAQKSSSCLKVCQLQCKKTDRETDKETYSAVCRSNSWLDTSSGSGNIDITVADLWLQATPHGSSLLCTLICILIRHSWVFVYTQMLGDKQFLVKRTVNIYVWWQPRLSIGQFCNMKQKFKCLPSTHTSLHLGVKTNALITRQPALIFPTS